METFTDLRNQGGVLVPWKSIPESCSGIQFLLRESAYIAVTLYNSQQLRAATKKQAFKKKPSKKQPSKKQSYENQPSEKQQFAVSESYNIMSKNELASLHKTSKPIKN